MDRDRRCRARRLGLRPWGWLRAGVLLVALAGCGGDRSVPPGLVAEARDSLARPVGTFEAEAELVAYLDSLVRVARGDVEVEAELALLRLRAIERVLEAPALQSYRPEGGGAGGEGEAASEAVRSWVRAHEGLIVYSEPAGQWLVPANVFWDLHDRYRTASYADELAWAAATAGMPGECEGFIGCYLDTMIETYVKYLELYPEGAHVEEAIGRLAEELTAIAPPVPSRPLCGDELTTEGVRPEQLKRIREAVEAVPLGRAIARDPVLSLVSILEQRCRT